MVNIHTLTSITRHTAKIVLVNVLQFSILHFISSNQSDLVVQSSPKIGSRMSSSGRPVAEKPDSNKQQT